MIAKDEDRFWAKVDKSPGLGPDGQCWEWTGCLVHNGYGQFRLGGSAKYAHRVLFVWINGSVAGDVCHSCDNRKCVRPDHLFEGTRKQNMADCVAKDRQVRGVRNGMSILDDVSALAIYRSTEPASALSLRYGIHPNTVYDIRNGRRWKHVCR